MGQERAKDSGDGGGAPVARTPKPSSFQQGVTLMKRNLRNDFSTRRGRILWVMRTLAVAGFLVLYTIGFATNYPDGDNGGEFESGGYRFHRGKNWTFPKTIYLAGQSDGLVRSVYDALDGQTAQINVDMESFNGTNTTSFSNFCQDLLSGRRLSSQCVFLSSQSQYRITYKGGSGTRPYEREIVATQQVINDALLRANGSINEFPALQTQPIPEVVVDKSNDELQTKPLALGFSLPIGAFTCLALVISASFLISPMVKEKKQEISNAFVRIGVPLRVYMLQWFTYLSLNSIITAGVLTAATVSFKLYPLSNGGLVFVSHYLMLVHFNSLWTVISQIVNQEELAQSLPFILFVISCVYAIPIVIFMWDDVGLMVTLLSIGGIFSPFIGVLNYSAMYVRFDAFGVDTGIQLSDVGESKLWMSYVSSVVGIIMYLSLIWNFSEVKAMLQRRPKRAADADSEGNTGEERSGIEPLGAHKEVLVSIRDLFHTFPSTGCFKKTKPVDVLRGLDLDLCRNEVLGYLGANGAGKSTTIQILSGELGLQEGSVSFDFSGGRVSMGSDTEILDYIRRRIGVCPQHNNLLGDDTCRETLRLFASLKGHLPMLPGQSVEEAIEAEVGRRLLDLKFTSDTDADKPVKTYSGGMKRKVCIAIAMIGDPEIIYLDEPTAGLDPYNRRVVWDLIIEAKAGRSIILCSHHLDEVDVLSDRVAILKKGQTVACGSTLFLKHHFGAGYTVAYTLEQSGSGAQDLRDVIMEAVGDAEEIDDPRLNHFAWNLKHGTEPAFPLLLSRLGAAGATNVTVELTTLEQVFLKTIKDDESENENDEAEGEDEDESAVEHEHLCRIWQPRATVTPLTWTKKFLAVSKFMMRNAWRMKEAISVNISFPLMYLVGGFVAVKLIGEPEESTRVFPDPFEIPKETEAVRFFGVPTGNATLAPSINLAGEINETSEYFVGNPIIGGYWSGNSTLQYNEDLTPFALQIGLQVLFNISSPEGIVTELLATPYDTDEGFRYDLLLLPIAVVFGFTGMVMTVLDVLTLKSDNIVDLFRVAGINEWTTYLGIMFYKMITTFIPFFSVVIILGASLQNVLFGNAGRWLATLVTMICYFYSGTPLGLLLGKRFIKSDFDSAKSWFPGVYFTLVTLPYVAWSISLQTLPDARDTIIIIGDIMCLFPPVAFQRSLGAVVEVSGKADDPNLSWSDVYEFKTRVVLSIVLMIFVGTCEWFYLYQLTTKRPQPEKLGPDLANEAHPIETQDEDVAEERARSLESDDGINTRDLVKIFKVKSKETPDGTLKKAVKGVSLSVKMNEIAVLLGPNGAGKTTLMSTISGGHAPEHGCVVLDGRKAAQNDPSVDHMFERTNVSWCPQYDSLFPQLKVSEHIEFYSVLRGLDRKEPATKEHIDAIIDLLGLRPHLEKKSTELSGGYKRRLSLAIAYIGYCSIMMVDECTSGVDPSARHKIWATLKPDYANEDYQLPATLLSTHYMDEASALGTKISIMIDGELVTTGSLNRLHERYCNSYFVEIALSQSAPDDSEASIMRCFHDEGMEASVYESVPLHLKIQVPFRSKDASRIDQLADIFRLMEENKESLSVKYYSVAQMDLEQIFIDLSRKQFQVDEVRMA